MGRVFSVFALVVLALSVGVNALSVFEFKDAMWKQTAKALKFSPSSAKYLAVCYTTFNGQLVSYNCFTRYPFIEAKPSSIGALIK